MRLDLDEGKSLPDWRLTLERRRGKVKVTESAMLQRKEAVYTFEKRPPAHYHTTDPGGTPVVVLDLHKTITPSEGFVDPAYDTGMAPPYEGCKEALDRLTAGGCCIHIATAGLSPYKQPEMLAVRQKMVASYVQTHSLPISFITGKVGAHVYYDDRAVRAEGDWPAILAEVLDRLDARFDMGEDGIWRRRPVKEVGEPLTYPPPDTMPPDQPRGLATPIINIDFHRCLTQSSSSKRDASPRPGAVEGTNALYDAGFQVHLSCAGWDPSSHTPDETSDRLAGLQQFARAWGIRYDLMVAKDHPDVSVDDKAYHHTDWGKDLPVLFELMGSPDSQDEITATSRAAP